MSKKPQDQKPEATSAAIVTMPARAAKPRKVATVGSGKKKAIPQSKSGRVLSLLKQTRGATLDDLMKATKWQAHSVRGFLSGAVRKRKGMTIISERDEEGTRRYRIAERLEAAGVARSDIVLGFQPPSVRPYTEYAAA